MRTQPLTDQYPSWSQKLRSFLHRSFPSACPGTVEDAVQDAYTCWLARGGGDESPSFAWLRVCAWRSLRARWRRADSRETELPTWEGTGPTQEVGVDLALHLEPTIRRSSRTWGGRNPEGLARALRERLLGEDSDVAVAHRHGVPRAGLNRARREVMWALLPGTC